MPYSSSWIRYIVTHWEELSDTGQVPEHCRVEFANLPINSICTCRENPLRQMERVGRSGGSAAEMASLGMPGSDAMDIERSYDALPMGWRGRTRVYLMMRDGLSEQAIYELPLATFQALHRRRIVTETARARHTEKPSPAPVVQEKGSVWRVMADYLNEGEPQAEVGLD